MTKILIAPERGARADQPFLYEPTTGSTPTMHYSPQFFDRAQELYRERLRQAEAQRLRRAALRARRSLAGRLFG